MESVGNREIPTAAEWKQHLAGPDTICGALYQLIDDLATLIPTAGTALTLSTSALTLPGDVTFTANVTMTLGASEALTLTCTDISAPIVMTNIMATAGKTGCRALFHVQADVALGGWANGVKGYLEFTGTSGRVTGLASGVNAELKMPNTTLSSGWYFPLEINYVAGGTSTTTAGTAGNRAGFIFMRASGDDDGDFDDNGGLFVATSLTAGAGHCLSLTSQTLKCWVGAYGTELTRYAVLSQTEDCLSLGISGTAMDFSTTAGTNAIYVNTTSAATSGDVRYIYGNHAATAAGSTAHRAEFHTTATAKLGGWANALKGYFEFGASGDITGLASGICAELKLPNANHSGTVCVMELELVTQTSSGVGTLTSLVYSNITGAGLRQSKLVVIYGI